MLIYIKYFKSPTTNLKFQHIFTHLHTSSHFFTLLHTSHIFTSTNMSSYTNSQPQLVTSADLLSGFAEDQVFGGAGANANADHISRIQQNFGCTWEVAQMAYEGFTLYIPHMWVGTKTHDDGRLKGEGLIYGVMRNLGIGFLTKSTDTKKAINITLREGRDGGRPHQSCEIKFDRLFTRGEENAGNIAVLEHLLAPPQKANGRDIFNHLEVIYQEAGPSKWPPHKDEPARFWKVFLWRPRPEHDAKPASPTTPTSKVKFTLVKAKPSSANSAAASFPTPLESVAIHPAERANAVEPVSPSYEDTINAEEGFETVGKSGKAN